MRNVEPPAVGEGGMGEDGRRNFSAEGGIPSQKSQGEGGLLGSPYSRMESGPSNFFFH